MGEAKRRSYEEERRLKRRAELRSTFLPRLVKAVGFFLIVVTIIPVALMAAWEGFKDDDLLWKK